MCPFHFAEKVPHLSTEMQMYISCVSVSIRYLHVGVGRVTYGYMQRHQIPFLRSPAKHFIVLERPVDIHLRLTVNTQTNSS